MMRRLPAIVAAALVGASTVTPARAHHAYALFFDLCKSLRLEGRVEAVQWKEPHVFIELALDDGTTYRAEWTSPRNLSRENIAADVLKAGDRIVVTGSTWKDRALMEPHIRPLVSDPPPRLVSALTQIRRASDGWSWVRGGAAANCSPK